jgi:hypothetical protein
LFIEFWKREQSKLQFEWDSIDFEKKSETIRPQFETRTARKRKNPITNLDEPYVTFWKKNLQFIISFSVVILMVNTFLIILI